MQNTSLQSWGITILRVVVGVVFLVHGLQKLFGGVEGVAGLLGGIGLPLPQIMAIVLIAVETLGGAALILGLFTRYAGALLAITMLVALFTVHLPNGFFVRDGGYEFVLTLMGASGALALTGSGALALDQLLFGGRQSTSTQPQTA